MKKLSRRKFIQLGSGFTVAFGTSGIWLQACRNQTPPIVSTISPWVQIRDDNKIIIHNPAAEMGQGSMTALPLIVAEEMDAEWDNVIIKDSPIDPAQFGHDGWGSRPMMAIVGSYAVEGYFNTLRLAGAQARLILRSMAAAYWQVALDATETKTGNVHSSDGKKISYGELVSKAALPADLPEVAESDLKQVDQFRLVRKSIPRRDIPAKVNGSATYSIDTRIADMTYALVQRAPVFGATVRDYNDRECIKVLGFVGAFKIDTGIAVVAETYESAARAREVLKVEWDEPATSSSYDSEQDRDSYRQELKAPDENFKELFARGSIGSVLRGGEKLITREFYNDYTYHAQLEPLNAVVHFEQTHATIWVGTQTPDSVLRNASEQLQLSEDKITVNRLYMGGGFGRRAKRDYVIEACQIARQITRPVKLTWTREDDIRHGTFRPNSLQKFDIILDNSGGIRSWDYKVAGPGKALLHTGAETPFYNIANQRIRALYLDRPSILCSWRAEGHGPNKFAIEAMIDEIASLVKIDPIGYRKRFMVTDQRALAVIDRVETMSEWKKSPPPGRAKGFSFCERSAVTATVCEISVENGVIRVHRVWIAVDAGLIVQPDNAKAQVEGGIIMGISSSLKEAITFKDGKVENSNLHNYHLLRCSEAPESIHVDFVQSSEKPIGIGEASVPGIGGAIANAFAALTGTRLYQMPFNPVRVKAALSGQ